MKPPRYKSKGKPGKPTGVRTSGRMSTVNRKTQRRHKSYHMRVPQSLWLICLALILGFGGIVGFFVGEEVRTSKIEAQYMTEMAAGVSFDMKEGAAERFYVPTAGPYNQRLGYSYLPFFFKALEADNYVVTAQVRGSARYHELVDNGLYPIYRPKNETGLHIEDRKAQTLYDVSYPAHVFKDFASIPKTLVDTLLFIEDRDLLKEGPVTRNPAIEWDRFFYAALGQALKLFAPNVNLGGGSTLATQIEKFRFSPGGQTNGISEKMRQIVSASLRIYLDGSDTREARQRIVLDYLNSTPLSARSGFGEINSIGDGLWAWFGRDIESLTKALNGSEADPESLRIKAMAFREALGLILAQRRPTYYLLTDRTALDDLTDQTLENMTKAKVISVALRDATRASKFHFLPEPPASPPVDFLEQKATNAIRTHLLKMLGLRNLYELDRLDLKATSTLDQKTQKEVTGFLRKMGDPEHVKSIGMLGFHLLSPENNLKKINWSVLLYERGKHGNLLRVQADNIDAPMDMNDGGKLDLGSTAKLRTLVTYLEIVGELYRRYAGLSVEDLGELTKEAPDVLTSWATIWLSSNPDATLREMLQASMDRKYSGNPHETFFTGGGAHTFVNFDKEEDHKMMDLRESLRDSVNLVFVRLMRDIVNYTIAQGQQTKQELLSDPDHPARKEYLERYADKEGATFLNRYISEYAPLSRENMIAKITQRAHKGATARTILFRSLDPAATFGEFVGYMKTAAPTLLDRERLHKLFKEYPADRYSLADRGYITGVNPLELWMVAYKLAHPQASRQTMLSVSKPVRLESYAWLFHPNKKGAQDTRIRILLELDAFARIQQRWARLGYPFDKLVPSFATAIGSSADRPGALAELVGILLNDGVRKPMQRFEKLSFAQGTPYETILMPDGIKADRVLDPAIAQVARAAMIEVVENGTARRLRGAYVDAVGNPLVIGGKTGTGDHRFDEFGAGHRLISSRVVNRTGTIMFFIGDRFFGTVTAHVAGEEAGNFKFTSALSAQMLKSLAPVIQPLITPPQEKSEDSASPQPAAESMDVSPASTLDPKASVDDAEKLDPNDVPVPTVRPSVAVPPAALKKAKPKQAPRKAPESNNELMMDILPR
ncbi:MAG: transglycosylase domain-containing protein [Alphaproteobacteria bacterium]|nr:transglycosylase domain-containing protein [Alphaproteobacteria bacterium]